jgi:hypothetical protein
VTAPTAYLCWKSVICDTSRLVKSILLLDRVGLAVLGGAIVMGALAGCGLAPSTSACAEDDECNPGRVCRAGRCTASVAGGPAAIDAASDARQGADAGSHTLADSSPSTNAQEDVAPGRGAADAAALAPSAEEPGRLHWGGFYSLAFETETRPLVLLARPYRQDLFAVRPSDGTLWHQSLHDTVATGWVDHVGGSRIVALDGACWSRDRWDLVVRDADGALEHVSADLDLERGWSGWTWKAVVGRGVGRPALVHLGPGQLVLFQIGVGREDAGAAAAGATMFARFSRERGWSGWTEGPAGPDGGGLDGATLFSDGRAIRVELVARGVRGELVGARWDPVTEALSAWEPLGNDPPGGSSGTPVIASFGTAAARYDVFAVGAGGTLWRSSSSGGASAPFVEMPGTAGTAPDFDAAASADPLRIDFMRRTPGSREVEHAALHLASMAGSSGVRR